MLTRKQNIQYLLFIYPYVPLMMLCGCVQQKFITVRTYQGHEKLCCLSWKWNASPKGLA